MNTHHPLSVAVLLLLGVCSVAQAESSAVSEDGLSVMARKPRNNTGDSGSTGGGSGGGSGATVPAPVLRTWMSTDLQGAWDAGYKGQGVAVKVIDDFKSRSRFYGDFGDGRQRLRHGEWTLKEASMLAPSASFATHDFNLGRTVTLSTGKLNVLNLSYGMYAASGYTAGNIGWSAQERSIISYAQNGHAVVSKAAGNDAIPIGTANSSGKVDYLNLALAGKASALFVGALNTNGTTANPASLAWYSNTPGTDTTIQNQFLVVGVQGDTTGLYGTSFAAPVITGYAAILGSKFTSASATQIANQLLSTARTDTLSDYDAAVYGKGEASLSRALTPVSIN